MCIEYLGHLIEGKCTTKLWSKVKASRDGPAFSHHFFADDLILFARVDIENCLAINEVLQEFCINSGQSISKAKSQIFFSPNVNLEHKEMLLNILRFQVTSNLCKYLGFPLKHSRVSIHDFDFVLNRVKLKLAGWKANLLSMVGRTVLIQAPSFTIPAHVM